MGFLGSTRGPRTEGRTILQESVPYSNVDGAVHRAAGPELQHALDALVARHGTRPAISSGAGPRVDAILPASSGHRTACPAGCAVHTPAFGSLREWARLVVHAVAPDGRGHHVHPKRRRGDAYHGLLRSTFAAAIAQADAAGARSVAIPSLGCGVHCWGLHDAARAALAATSEWLQRPSGVERVDFVLLSDEARAVWEAHARERLGAPTAAAAPTATWEAPGCDGSS